YVEMDLLFLCHVIGYVWVKGNFGTGTCIDIPKNIIYALCRRLPKDANNSKILVFSDEFVKKSTLKSPASMILSSEFWVIAFNASPICVTNRTISPFGGR
ncbi:hypothetical protein HHI36_021782, partial [Cryptolaemus montrouzieri]